LVTAQEVVGSTPAEFTRSKSELLKTLIFRSFSFIRLTGNTTKSHAAQSDERQSTTDNQIPFYNFTEFIFAGKQQLTAECSFSFSNSI
jgi:hypothetical protein